MIEPSELNIKDRGSSFVVGTMPTTHKQFTYLKQGALVTLFDGIDTALDYIAKELPNAAREKASTDYEQGFNVFKTYDEAMKTYRTKPQSVVKYDPTELKVRDINEAGSIVDYDVTGDYIDMGRYMEGVPESWGSMHNGNARNRRVNIIVNLNFSSGVAERTILHRGERILRLVDALEGSGVRTQLQAIESTECGHFEFTLKQHDEPLTISDLAVVTHPDWLRRIIFRLCEYSNTWEYGYGMPRRFGHAVTPDNLEGDNLNELTIFIGDVQHDTDTVFDQLERLLVWEMSKPVPEVSAVKVDQGGVWFNANGARAESEIKEEGMVAIRG